MKKLLIVANWKSNKTVSQAKEWLEGLQIEDLGIKNKEVIICAPFTLLPFLRSYFLHPTSDIQLGGQDVSPFFEGAYTGAVNGKQLKEFADYVIIGHSERREHFHETDEELEQKVQQALAFGLTPVFCVQGVETPIPDGVAIVAYEPLSAIGTGNPDTPENAQEVARVIKEKHRMVHAVLYGGSVTPENVNSFTQMEHIDGVLVGGASLDSTVFTQLIENA